MRFLIPGVFFIVMFMLGVIEGKDQRLADIQMMIEKERETSMLAINSLRLEASINRERYLRFKRGVEMLTMETYGPDECVVEVDADLLADGLFRTKYRKEVCE